MKTMQKRGILRRGLALVLAAVVLWVVFATAGSADLPSALGLLEQEGGLAITLLQRTLGEREEEAWAFGPSALAISQSPLLLAGREAVLELRREEELSEEKQPEAPPPPIEERPVEPTQPDSSSGQADNGVPAKTLLPGESGEYLVSGLAYVSNTSDCELRAEELTGSYTHLGEGEPQVLILHTHGSEAYTMPPGQEYEPSSEYRTTDTAYNVVRVGDEIAAVLAAEGISVVHDRSLYDYPNYGGAYGRAMESVMAYLERYPSISFVLDIHRDAITDSEGNMYKIITDTAEGRAAQLALVMGTDGGGSDHSRWRENLRLAVAVQNRLLEEHPQLMRPIALRNSHYNQMASPGSLLLEVGAAGNSLEEALLAARFFAKGLADVIQ